VKRRRASSNFASCKGQGRRTNDASRSLRRFRQASEDSARLHERQCTLRGRLSTRRLPCRKFRPSEPVRPAANGTGSQFPSNAKGRQDTRRRHAICSDTPADIDKFRQCHAAANAHGDEPHRRLRVWCLPISNERHRGVHMPSLPQTPWHRTCSQCGAGIKGAWNTFSMTRQEGLNKWANSEFEFSKVKLKPPSPESQPGIGNSAPKTAEFR